MSDLLEELQSAFEARGYTVGEAGRNRGRVRIELLEADAPAAELRSATEEVAGEDGVMGLNVTTESTDGKGVRTVVSFRER